MDNQRSSESGMKSSYSKESNKVEKEADAECAESRQLREEREQSRREHDKAMAAMMEQINEIMQNAKKESRDAVERAKNDREEFLKLEQEKTEQMQAESQRNRTEMEQRIREIEARDAAEREVRDREWKASHEKAKQKTEALREERERTKKEDNEQWEKRNRQSEMQLQDDRDSFTREQNRIREDRENKLRALFEASEHQRMLHGERLRFEKEKIARAQQAYFERWIFLMRDLATRMKQKMWTEHIEQQWAMRLAGLRESHSPVSQSFIDLRFDLDNMVKRSGDGMSAIERAEIEMKLTLLIEHINVEICTMENEVEDMRRMAFEHPEAPFLADIETAASSIANGARQVLSFILEIENHLKTEFESPLCMELWKTCLQNYEQLEKDVDSIPTVFGLKAKYQS